MENLQLLLQQEWWKTNNDHLFFFSFAFQDKYEEVVVTELVKAILRSMGTVGRAAKCNVTLCNLMDTLEGLSTQKIRDSGKQLLQIVHNFYCINS